MTTPTDRSSTRRSRPAPSTRRFYDAAGDVPVHCDHCGTPIQDLAQGRLLRRSDLIPEDRRVALVHVQCEAVYRSRNEVSYHTYDLTTRDAAWFAPLLV